MTNIISDSITDTITEEKNTSQNEQEFSDFVEIPKDHLEESLQHDVQDDKKVTCQNAGLDDDEEHVNQEEEFFTETIPLFPDVPNFLYSSQELFIQESDQNLNREENKKEEEVLKVQESLESVEKTKQTPILINKNVETEYTQTEEHDNKPEDGFEQHFIEEYNEQEVNEQTTNKQTQKTDENFDKIVHMIKPLTPIIIPTIPLPSLTGDVSATSHKSLVDDERLEKRMKKFFKLFVEKHFKQEQNSYVTMSDVVERANRVRPVKIPIITKRDVFRYLSPGSWIIAGTEHVLKGNYLFSNQKKVF